MKSSDRQLLNHSKLMKNIINGFMFLLIISISSISYAANENASINGQIHSLSKGKISKQDLDIILAKDEMDYIILLKDDATAESMKNMKGLARVKAKADHSKRNFRSLKNNPEITKFRDYSMLPMVAIKSSKKGLMKIMKRDDVITIFENKRYQALTSESLPLINHPVPISQGHIGTGTSIAVLDSGVDYTHSTFGGCTSPGFPNSCKVVVAQDFAPNDNTLDHSGHGTNVAAIASSVAPGAEIIALDIFTGNGIDVDDAVDAMNWVIAHRDAYDIKVMNNSWGAINGPAFSSVCSTAITPVVSTAKSVGIATVFASGNDRHTTGIAGPSCTEGVISVGAVYDSNFGFADFTQNFGCSDSTTFSDKVTCFSNSGSLLTLLAPGSRIIAGGGNFSGTSQAAPHVAGAIAVMNAPDVAPNDNVDQTVARLINTGTLVTDNRNNVEKPRLDIAAAVNDAIGNPLPAGAPVAQTPAQGSTISDNTPTFTWTEASGATKYAVVVTDSNNSSPINNSTGTITCPGGVCSYTHPSVVLADGNYTWNVRVINPDNSNGPQSATLSFVVDTGGTPPSSSLTPVSPTNGQTVNTSTPIFTWTAHAGATAYAVEALDAAGNQVIYRSVLASNAGCSSGTGNCTASFSDIIPDGVITWRVRLSPNTIGYGATATFTVATGGTSLPNQCQSTPPVTGQVMEGVPVCITADGSGQAQMHFNVTSANVGETLIIRTGHGSGEGSILHKKAGRPSLPNNYDYISNDPGTEDTLVIPNVQSSWNYIHFSTTSTFSGVTLLVEYQ